MSTVQLPENLRLLTIVAHPHDATYTLGTSAHHIERGDSVTVVSVTDGVTTHDEELEDEMRKPEAERDPAILNRSRSDQAQRKQEELGRVCGLFGIEDVRVLPFADNPIEPGPEVVKTLVDIFYEVRPHIVITHAPYNYPHHGHYPIIDHDHPAAGILAARAMQRISQPDKDRVRPPHKVAQIYYIGVEFGWTDIDLFVDISDQMANRIRAEGLYETQGHTPEFARKRIEAFAGYHGWFGNSGYAEPFIRARGQFSSHLSVTDRELEQSLETGKQNLERIGYFASGQPG